MSRTGIVFRNCNSAVFSFGQAVNHYLIRQLSNRSDRNHRLPEKIGILDEELNLPDLSTVVGGRSDHFKGFTFSEYGLMSWCDEADLWRKIRHDIQKAELNCCVPVDIFGNCAKSIQ